MIQPVMGQTQFADSLFAGEGLVVYFRSVAVDCREFSDSWLNSSGFDAAWADIKEITAPWSDERTFEDGGCLIVAKLNVKIEKYVRGDDLDISRTYGNVPDGDSVVQAWITFKNKPKDPDNLAILQLSITGTPAASGQITDSGVSAPKKTSLKFTLSPAQTRLFTAGKAYSYDIQLKTAAGKINTREKGTLVLEEEITITSS